eukprot:11191237-Lingulodinium_polyedra.AAC.1
MRTAVRMMYARVRCLSRRSGGRSIRPRNRSRFAKPCAKPCTHMRSNRLSAVAAVQKSHARAHHAN